MRLGKNAPSASVRYGGSWFVVVWLGGLVFGKRMSLFEPVPACFVAARRDGLVARGGSGQRRPCHLPTAVCLLIVAWFGAAAAPAWPQARQSVAIRGHPQSLFIYGSPRGDPVIVSSGDGGWIHLGPHVAEFLSSQGFYVVGFDVKAYLSGFTSGQSTVRAEDEPGDYHVLTQSARQSTGKRPILIGVSEGAGLSVLAATDAATKADIAGIIALGLPDLTELGWRWKDAVIYLTHRAPDEPTFSVAAIVDRVAPVPLAAIHSTHDEFVTVAEVERVLTRAKDPKRLWMVDASNHRFSDNLAELDRHLIDAIAWVKANSPR